MSDIRHSLGCVMFGDRQGCSICLENFEARHRDEEWSKAALSLPDLDALKRNRDWAARTGYPGPWFCTRCSAKLASLEAPHVCAFSPPPELIDRIGDAAARKAAPLCSGVLDYFSDALLAVAEVSRVGNDQHNPGEPLGWTRGKSDDHADSALRHFIDRGTTDSDGVGHTAKAAWRILALLQLEIEAAKKLPPARAVRKPTEPPP